MKTPDPRVLALGQEIRGEAAAQGLTVAELAKRADVNRSSLYTWLDGTAAMPMYGIVAVADVLRVAPEELVRRGMVRARRNNS